MSEVEEAVLPSDGMAPSIFDTKDSGRLSCDRKGSVEDENGLNLSR